MSVLLNRVRRGAYADSVMLMRIARQLEGAGGVLMASLLIGTPSNLALLEESDLLAKEGKSARPEDLVIAVRAKSAGQAKDALEFAEKLLASGPASSAGGSYPTLSAAAQSLSGANLALISVPGEFAAREARRALARGLHAMVFSDNVPLEEEVALKEEALERGLLLMGPDCGTALIGGVAIAFANAVPRGEIGIVSASGTGLQEVSVLLARAGRGVSHGIGVGGRDLSEPVGGRMTLAALDALEADPATKRIVVISKPPAPSVARKIEERAARSRKPVTLCLLGARGAVVRTLEDAAGFEPRKQFKVKARGAIRGLFCGGTLCAEAQVILRDHGIEGAPHALVDLGGDEFTRGKPHPMIEPALRNEHLEKALRDKNVGVILLDVVIGYGAHRDPAGLLADVLQKNGGTKKLVLASVTGTENDPQVYSRQVKVLERAGVVVAESNAQAARLAATALRDRPSRASRRRRSAPRSRSR